ncbi:MAG: hypothetical protein AB1458_10935 [Bacteroidota bacterium]
MRSTENFLSDKAALIGAALLIFPALFWTAVTADLVFKDSFLLEKVILRLDVPLIAVLLMVVAPGIAFLINLFSILRLSFRAEEGEWIFTCRLQPKMLNIALLLFAACSTACVLLYAFLENFTIVPSHV